MEKYLGNDRFSVHKNEQTIGDKETNGHKTLDDKTIFATKIKWGLKIFGT